MDGRRWASSLLVGAAGVALIVSCSSGATTTPVVSGSPLPSEAAIPSVEPSRASPSPAATIAATPSPSPRPSPGSPKPPAPSWTNAADDLAWHRLAAVPISSAQGIVGFAKGYVVLDGEAGNAWFSTAGRSWKRVELPGADGTDANGLRARVIATNGRQLLVVGGYEHEPCVQQAPGSTGGGPECVHSPIAWVSRDGISWRRATPPDTDGEFVAAWPVTGGGWNAALSDWYGECLGGNTLWHSADGISWTPVARRPPAAWEGYDHAPLVVTNGSGRYLLAASERGDDRTTLAQTADGRTWRVLKGFPGKGAEVFTGTAPAADRTRWVLGGQSGCGEDGCGGGPTIWSSADRVRWTATVLPVGPGVPGVDPEMPVVVTTVTSLVLSERGYVAVGAEESWSEGARHETWVSDDGISWTRLAGTERPTFDYGPGLVADGPAGIIGISGSDASESADVTAWQLR